MSEDRVQVVLVGAGIMSATVGVLLKQLMPDVHISLFECLDMAAAESSDALNNSGTGHAAYCELNYTPQMNGQENTTNALNIAERFEVSKQFWAFLKETGAIAYQHPFINAVPHMSFVSGDENTKFLRKRYEAMRKAPIFQDMQFSAEPTEIEEWAPLIMEGRDRSIALAATKMDAGTDVNFGAITRNMVSYLENCEDVSVNYRHRVVDIKQNSGRWRIQVEDYVHKKQQVRDADYVFIGAGGGALPLLKKTTIEEARGYGGLPVSGQFLMCSNPAVVRRHHAKVYGKAEVGTPPMSVPHLDTRIIDGQRILLFGPYAGFTTKFLKNGSYLDLPLSIGRENIWPMLTAGMPNRSLASYLIKQVLQSAKQRFRALQEYYPNAQQEDWTLTIAGQRVQVIQKGKDNGGVLKFGTEIVSSADGSVAALLGASPGASTSVSIALEVITRMFPDRIASKAWQQSLKKIIPSYGESLIDDGDLCLTTRARTHEILELT
ncbi:MAG: malate dehydrogenase (quinone) [Thiotrichales bacterium]